MDKIDFDKMLRISAPTDEAEYVDFGGIEFDEHYIAPLEKPAKIQESQRSEFPIGETILIDAKRNKKQIEDQIKYTDNIQNFIDRANNRKPELKFKNLIKYYENIAKELEGVKKIYDKIISFFDNDTNESFNQDSLSESIFVVKQGSKEWDYLWSELAKLSINQGLPKPTEAEDEDTGETWQYMGTVIQGNGLVHQFRHRNHPKTKKRELVNIAVSPKMQLV
jgi:hypothetical protein